MLKIRRTSKILRSIAILILFFTLSFYYLNLQKNKEFTYFDESWSWVCRSYFFDYLIRGDLNSDVWFSYHSYDDPKLAEYMYGLILYPKYLYERHFFNNKLSYSAFLNSKGFYCDRSDYSKNMGALSLRYGDHGTKEDLISRYGNGIIEHLNTISYSRKINSFILALAVLVFAYLVLKISGLLASLLFLFLYGFNSFVIDVSLFAHSEALFLLMFNLSVLFIFKFICLGKTKDMIIFSILSGLTMSVKLNGLMIILIFILVSFINMEYRKKIDKYFLFERIKQISMAAIITFSVFVLLNPFTWKRPFLNTLYMFKHRFEIVDLQTRLFSADSILSLDSRVVRLFNNYFGNGKFNYINPDIKQINNNKFMLFLFILGVLSILFDKNKYNKLLTIFNYAPKKVYKKGLMIFVFLSIFIITLFYLKLDWSRYYIHLTAFFVYFEVLGLVFILQLIKYLSRRTHFFKFK